MAICKTGLWVDKKTREVVDSEPVEGRLLVAKGTDMTPHVDAMVERARAEAPVVEKPAVEDHGGEGGPETASLASASETAAVTGRTGKPQRR